MVTFKSFLKLSVISFFCVSSLDAVINITDYSYLNAPSSTYPDSGGVELTDGTDVTIAWGAGIGISFADVAPLSGWQSTDPIIRFEFGEMVTVQSATAWFADSDSAAGVGLPSDVTLSTDGMSVVFSEVFGVTNPAGDGTTVPIGLNGFSVTTDHLILTSSRASSWTMLSEVTFSAVPEPSSYAALVGILSLSAVVIARRRRN